LSTREDEAVEAIAKALDLWCRGRTPAEMREVFGETLDVDGFECRIVPCPLEPGQPLRADIELLRAGKVVATARVEVRDKAPPILH